MTYNNFWVGVGNVLKGSLFGRLFFKLVNTVAGAFHASWLYSFFTAKDMEDYARSSVIARFFRHVLFESSFAEMVSQSAAVRFLCYFPEYLFSSQVSLLSFYLIPSGILMFVRFCGNIGYMIAFALVIVLGTVFLSFRTTLGNVISGSAVLGGLCRFFGIKTQGSRSVSLKKSAWIALAVGTAVGAASFVLTDKLSVIAFAALIVFPLAAASPLLLIVLSLFAGIAFSTLPASVLAGVTVVIVLCRLFCGEEQLPPLRPAYIFVLMYLLLTLFYTFFGYGGSDSVLAGTIHAVFLLLFFAVVIVVNTADKLKRLVFSVSVCTLYTGFLGIYQRIAGQGGTGWSYTEQYVGGLRRISATFLNPNVYGEFIILAVCIIIAAILLSDRLWQRLLFIGCLAIQIINLGLTYSRGCYISVAAAALIVIWCCDKRLLGAGIFALPAVPYVLPQNIITRILSVGDYLKDGSVLYRFSIWSSCLRVIQNHWYVGSGIGTVAFTAFYQNYMIKGVTAQHSHNTFIQITIELSILALVLMLLLAVFLIKDICRTVKNSGIGTKALIIPFAAALCAVLVEGLVDYIFYNNIVYMFFWAVLALLIAGLNIAEKEKRKTVRL